MSVSGFFVCNDCVGLPDCAPILHLIEPGMRGVEIGVDLGISSAAFLAAGASMWLIDPFGSAQDYNEKLGSGPALTEAMARIAGFRGWRLFVGTSVEASEEMADIEFDFVFIDGDHRFEYVARDCRTWWRRLKPGGWLLGHDYNLAVSFAGVREAVDEFAEFVKKPVQVFDNPEDPKRLQCWGLKKE